MFPNPPEGPSAPPIPTGPTLEWPTVTPEEIAEAIRTSVPNKAPGPDGMCSGPVADPWMAWLCSGPFVDPGHPRMARGIHG